ncbi:unnamed protein product, partial [Staurois parvus]
AGPTGVTWVPVRPPIASTLPCAHFDNLLTGLLRLSHFVIGCWQIIRPSNAIWCTPGPISYHGPPKPPGHAAC